MNSTDIFKNIYGEYDFYNYMTNFTYLSILDFQRKGTGGLGVTTVFVKEKICHFLDVKMENKTELVSAIIHHQ